MNIHEAVLQPIAAFVYCNPRQQQAVAGRQKSEISTRLKLFQRILAAKIL